MRGNEFLQSDEDRLTAGKLIDAANMCYKRDIPVATDFLDLNKQSVFHRINSSSEWPPVYYVMDGGYDTAERKMIIFLPYEDFPYNQPYDIIRIKPANPRFAESLTHRDYLGSLMGLGITRDKLGDVVLDDGCAYVFADANISDYIISGLCQVKHTTVTASTVDKLDFNYTPAFEEIKGTVASVRLDSVISLGFGGSRNSMISHIENGQTAVNGRIITTNAYNLKPDDIISVRGLGKIRFVNSVASTKKGRLVVVIHKYV